MNPQFGFGLMMGIGLTCTILGLRGMLGPFGAFKFLTCIGGTTLIGSFIYLKYFN